MGPADDQAQIGGQDGGQIHQAVEAKSVAQGAPHAYQAEGIFNAEQDGDGPFQAAQPGAVSVADLGHRLQQHRGHAHKDQAEQDQVKGLARRGFRLKDHFVQLALPWGKRACHGSLQH